MSCTVRNKITNKSVIQEFPYKGILVKNMNLVKKEIHSILNSYKPSLIYSYVLTTVKKVKDSNAFKQTGSAPNFQGDHITLCTCMHHMRCMLHPKDWEDNVWIAGITGLNSYGKNSLFYLMKIEKAFETQRDLWESKIISKLDHDQKNTVHNILGDLYVPLKNRKDYFETLSYKPPMLGHAHRRTADAENWQYDINYYHNLYRKYQSFLVGYPKLSFIWSEPEIDIRYMKNRYHPRVKKWENFEDFIEILI